MGFKLVEAVYGLDRNATTSTEQAVLLALAFRANDKTLLCYPKQDTIAQMTHLSRATVATALNALRQKGILDWKSGGIKNRRGKYGQPLANDYRLNLSTTCKKAEIKGGHGVQQLDTAVSSCQTRQCLTPGHSGVQLPDTAVSNSQTPTENTTATPSSLTTPIPNIGESESDLGEVLKSMGIRSVADGGRRRGRVEDSPLMMALHLCGIAPEAASYRDNYRAFSCVMVKLGMSRSMEVVRTFESEMRHGEMDNVYNPAALLMTRLQQQLR